MSDVLRARLIAAREAASTAAEVCAAVADVEWFNLRSCAAPERPTPADLAAWLAECDEGALQDADKLLSDVYGAPARWERATDADGDPLTLAAAVTVAIPAAQRARLGDSTTALRPLADAPAGAGWYQYATQRARAPPGATLTPWRLAGYWMQ